MRPLIAPLPEARADDAARSPRDIVPDLLDRFGAYCSICERPLMEAAFAWDSETGRTVSPYQPALASPQSLLLCATCEAVQAERDNSAGDLSLPFEEPTFAPFVSYYPDGSMFPRPAVGAGPAELTLWYFGLLQRRETDPRVRLQGRTWKVAERAVERLLIDETGLETLWLPDLIAATGFLSLWVAFLAEALPKPEALSDFLGQAQKRNPDFFPGTDWDRLLQEGPGRLQR
jgi:hypothetical protein